MSSRGAVALRVCFLRAGPGDTLPWFQPGEPTGGSVRAVGGTARRALQERALAAGSLRGLWRGGACDTPILLLTTGLLRALVQCVRDGHLRDARWLMTDGWMGNAQRTGERFRELFVSFLMRSTPGAVRVPGDDRENVTIFRNLVEACVFRDWDWGLHFVVLAALEEYRVQVYPHCTVQSPLCPPDMFATYGLLGAARAGSIPWMERFAALIIDPGPDSQRRTTTDTSVRALHRALDSVGGVSEVGGGVRSTVEALEWLSTHAGLEVADATYVCGATRAGNAPVLRWLHGKHGSLHGSLHGGPIDDLAIEELLKGACESGDLDCLAFLLHEFGFSGGALGTDQVPGFTATMNTQLVAIAISRGDLPMLRYLTDARRRAALTEQEAEEENVQHALEQIAGSAHGLSVLEWLDTNAAPFLARTLRCSSSSPGVAGNRIMLRAVHGGHESLAKWLHGVHGVARPVPTSLGPGIATAPMPLIEWLTAGVEEHIPCCVAVTDAAAATGRLQLLEYLFQLPQAVACSGDGLDAAARHGHLPVVEYLVRGGSDRVQHVVHRSMAGYDDEGPLVNAASAGRLSVVEWLVAHRAAAATDQSSSSSSATIDTIDALHAGVLRRAFVDGHTRVLDYLLRCRPSLRHAINHTSLGLYGQLDVVELFFRDLPRDRIQQAAQESLAHVAGDRSVAIAEFLLRQGGEAALETIRTPRCLLWAISGYRADAARFLLERCQSPIDATHVRAVSAAKYVEDGRGTRHSCYGAFKVRQLIESRANIGVKVYGAILSLWS